ncbi:MAG: DUF2087 domain-containing protein, partial [Dehalococcoidia bacterium]|nr:DUF2087 domain-containing protein [Dehalococcoidia bacterium]
ETMTERQISAHIDTLTAFRDAAQIRRGMVEHRMVTRDLEGRAYLRLEQAPPPEARALIAAVSERQRSGAV